MINRSILISLGVNNNKNQRSSNIEDELFEAMQDWVADDNFEDNCIMVGGASQRDSIEYNDELIEDKKQN